MRLSLVPKMLAVLSLAALAAGPFGRPAAAAESSITLGVTAGPHAQIAEAVAEVAKTKGLDIKLVEFTDGLLLNTATERGEIDANAFQHTPYLNQQVKDRGLKVKSVARTVLMPIAGYSRKYKSLDELPQNAVVAIPNDPSNAGRALKLLETRGLIKLRPGVASNATELDIIENPKNFRILPLEQAQLPRALADVDFAVINTHFAINAGLLPSRDALLVEGELSEYFCLIGVGEKNLQQPWVPVLVESFRSPEVKAFIDKKFQGNIIAGW
ncbi:MetQ/NlpA family ABC transporter substrate-binding protein [Xanthobacter sediminis]